jgi:hypothetical protein
VWLLPLICIACVEVATPEIDFNVTLLGDSGAFVVTGTAALEDNNGPCPVWYGDNGYTYHLFQSPRLDNGLFDQVVVPGTTSRLVLVLRSDLELACAFGRTAEVIDVLYVSD